MKLSTFRSFPLSLILAILSSVPRLMAAPGDLDLRFNGTGTVSTDTGRDINVATSVLIQNDGKIVLAGYAGTGAPASSNEDFALLRYHANGSLDTSFNGSGKVIVTTSSSDRAQSAALQSDGKILIGGFASSGSDADFVLLRFNADGTRDTGFGTGGKVVTGTLSSSEIAQSVVLQSDGKIIMGGRAWAPGSGFVFKLVRYQSNGDLDMGFNGSGSATTDFITGGENHGQSVRVQPDGKILFAGSTYIQGTYDFALARFNSNGTLDTSFNGTGKVVTTVGSGNDLPNSMAVQSDGRIIVAGTVTAGGTDKFGLVRYLPNGSLDTTFNGTGKVITTIGGTAVANAVTLQGDGKILVAGLSTNIAEPNAFALARYLPDGSLDTSFNGDGIALTVIDESSQAGALAVQPDGKIVVAGSSSVEGRSRMAVARYHAFHQPHLSVEQPAGTPLANAGALPLDFGPVTGSGSKVFTLRNSGAADLNILAVTLAAEGHPADFTVRTAGPQTLVPDSEITFSVEFSPSAPGARTATLRIASSDPDENPFLVPLTGRQATPLDLWRQSFFGNVSNTGAGADLSDPDGDGIANLVEYATGSHPLALTPPVGRLEKNGSSLDFTYTRPKAALADMTYKLEWSESLNGTWSSVGGSATVLSDDGIQQSVRHSIAAGINGKRFVRLRVTRK